MCKDSLLVAYLAASSAVQSAHAAEQPAADAVTSKSTGSIEIFAQRHTPTYAEVDRSRTLSLRLVEELAATGLTTTTACPTGLAGG